MKGLPITKVGPLEIARENLEAFADNVIQQYILRSVVDAYVAQNAMTDILGEPPPETDPLESIWTAMADTLKEKGITA
jgi:hypothetical protein